MAEELVRIGAQYGLTVFQVNDARLAYLDMDHDSFVDRSFVCGDEIDVGFYEDPEKRTISVFHEIGHRVTEESAHEVSTEGPDFKVAPELIAWLLGIREAALHGIHFSADTINWALEQALTYRGYQ